MSAMIRDFMATGKDICEGPQVLNVIQAIRDEPEHWGNVKLVLAHSDHLKTFTKIQNDLEIEKECLKMFDTLNVALVAKEIGRNAIRTIEVGRLRKVLAPLKRLAKGWDCQEAKD